ncbi:band 7 protein AGAP004871-like isoform X1 [Dermacentor variabilis]|uniref:band 7 protein AGAP004871-like isoform X1 n=1 Tax=Dermacentor variabilis TaxID=34621 RepID=UPI003F5BD536
MTPDNPGSSPAFSEGDEGGGGRRVGGARRVFKFRNLRSLARTQLGRAVNRARELRESAEAGLGICGWILTVLSFVIVVATFPFSLLFCIKVVQEYERAVIFRLGRLLQGGSKGPGIFFILPCIENYTKVDLRTLTFDVPPQEVLTKDSVTVSVDAVVYYRVHNAAVSVANVENAHHSTRLLAQTTLRNILGTRNLHEILADREQISNAMQSALDECTDAWGIKVERVEIKDVRLPVQLQRAMAAEAEAAREARAKLIAAEGEQKSSRALKEAADVMSLSPAALQLRYLQTLNTISAEKNSTIIFPLPIDFLACFMPDKRKHRVLDPDP